ncbi:MULTISPECIES: WASH complex subunit 5 [Acetobacter]|nr:MULTISPECIES: WASH complex subunit 5 [Acetobacter]
MPNLSYQLTAAQLEATLQVKQSIDDMRTALQQLIRMQATGAKVP